MNQAIFAIGALLVLFQIQATTFAAPATGGQSSGTNPSQGLLSGLTTGLGSILTKAPTKSTGATGVDISVVANVQAAAPSIQEPVTEEEIGSAKDKVTSTVQDKVEGAADKVQEMGKAIQDQVTAAKEKAEEAKQVIQDQVAAGKEKVEEAKQVIQDQVAAGKEKVEEAKQVIQDQVAAATEKAEEAKQVIQDQVAAGKEKVEEAKQVIQDQVAAGEEKVEEAKDKIQDSVTELVQKLKEEIKRELEDLKTTNPKSVEEIKKILEDLYNRIQEKKGDLSTEQIQQIFTDVVSEITTQPAATQVDQSADNAADTASIPKVSSTVELNLS